ncbi:unnamed protein product, partial [Mesorhabditis spiculigera]
MSIFSGRSRFLGYETDVITAVKQLPRDIFYLTTNGRIIDTEALDGLGKDEPFNVVFRLPGGKGGFGALLRSFRVNKSTNKDMMRNLDGRRLGAVEKEKKIRKWFEKKEERERLAVEKRKAKMAKLKSKAPHDFKESEQFEEERKELEEKAEAAFEDALKNLLESTDAGDDKKKKKQKTSQEPQSSSSDDSDSDPEMPGTSGFSFGKSKKRKAVHFGEADLGPSAAKNKRQETVTVTVVEQPKVEKPIVKKPEVVVEKAEKPQPQAEAPATKKEEETPSPPKDFPAVLLDDFADAAQLQALGLHHLKHALEARGLKCGGSLEERAARLYSIKGLPADKYPKNIRAAARPKPAKK